MRFASVLVLVPLATVPLQCAVAQQRRDSVALHCPYVVKDGPCPLYEASILQLIARPDIYDGKRVRVVGYIHFEFEGNGVYLHREDFERHLYRNGLWVELASATAGGEQCQDRYVLIEGTFQAEDHGHLGLWSGAIIDITRCMPWGEPPNQRLDPSGAQKTGARGSAGADLQLRK